MVVKKKLTYDVKHILGSLLAKVEIKSHSGINNLDVFTVKELCYMRDNFYYNILSYHDLIKLIEEICIN